MTTARGTPYRPERSRMPVNASYRAARSGGWRSPMRREMAGWGRDQARARANASARNRVTSASRNASRSFGDTSAGRRASLVMTCENDASSSLLQLAEPTTRRGGSHPDAILRATTAKTSACVPGAARCARSRARSARWTRISPVERSARSRARSADGHARAVPSSVPRRAKRSSGSSLPD